MKTIRYKAKIILLLFASLILGTTGCDDEWLEPKPLFLFCT
jgi:hypothetical protein